jgi:hypothetical protein
MVLNKPKARMMYKMMKILLMKQRDLISVVVMSVPGNWL